MKQLIKNNIHYGFVFIQFLVYYYLFIENKVIAFDEFSSYILCIVTTINSYFFAKNMKIKENIYFSKWYYVLFLILINLSISFFIGGKQIFMNSFKMPITLSLFNFFLFFLLNIVVFPYVCNILYFLDNLKIKRKKERKITKKECVKTWILLFIIIFIICLVVCYGFYPGNMTSDSIDQWTQAIGMSNIVDAHPPFYTIIIRFISLIGKSPFYVILANIIFYDVVFSSIMTYFYKNGINRKIITIITFCFTICCNNLCLLTTMWKDVPFTISLLWLTFEIYRIVQEKDNYFKRKHNIILLILALCLTYFFRVNGMFPYYITLIILMYYFFKLNSKKKILIVISGSLALIFIIKYPIYNMFDVQKSDNSSGTLSFAAKGLGALIYYDADIFDETREISEKILSYNVFKKNYLPYNIDSYAFGQENWNNGLANVSSFEMFGMYVKESFNNPSIIIRDRLDGNNLLWSYMTPDDGFNSTYVDGVWFPQNFDAEILNLEINDVNNNYYPPDNIINKIFRAYRNLYDKYSILYIPFWRTGFSLSLFLIITFWIFIKNKKYIPILLPSIINILFWFMLMSHQSYRYVWFIFVNTFFIYLFIIFNPLKKVVNDDGKN